MSAVEDVPNNQDITGVLWGWKWDSHNLTYQIPSHISDYVYPGGYENIPADEFYIMNNDQVNAAAAVLEKIQTFTQLTFTPSGSQESTTLRYGMADRIDYSNNWADPFGLLHFPGLKPNSAEGNPPDPTLVPDYVFGDIWFSSTNFNNPQNGNYAYTAGFMHETGHALGLAHGQTEQDVNHITHHHTKPKLPVDHMDIEYSIMTNVPYIGAPEQISPQYPTSYMLDDIAALQWLYGANYNHSSDNSTYTWSTSTGGMLINGFQLEPSAFQNYTFQTVWDGGGIDTYDLSNRTTDTSIDLAPGGWVIFDTSASHYQRANLDKFGGDHFARFNVANAWADPNNPSETQSLIEHAIGGSGSDTITGNILNNNLYGVNGNDTINGGAGNDWIDGGAGNDTMVGGLGNDSYQVDSGADVVTENVNEGIDTVYSYYSYFLGPNVENLVLYGYDFRFGEGNELANVIGGNGGDNILDGYGGNDQLYGYTGGDLLDGGVGADLMVGGDDNDQYVVDNAGDVVTETASGGNNDDLTTYITYTVPDNVEIMRLASSAGDIGALGNAQGNALYGNSGNNGLYGYGGSDYIEGGAGNDWIDGGSGFDQMIGGLGDDSYQFDDLDDSIVEHANEGTDTIYSYFTFSLNLQNGHYDSIENLILYGSSNLNGTGNALNNAIGGNNGSNTLTGWYGDDQLYGYGGIDYLYGEGNDDTLEGGGGADRLDGGEGFDTVSYSTSSSGVQVSLAQPNFNVGADAVGDQYISIENLTGSAYSDVLVGDTARNVLHGGDGPDIIMGGGMSGGNVGYERLYGDNGDDTFYADPGVSQYEEFYGGNDTDTVSYEQAGARVQVSLISGGGGIDAAGGDTYSSIEKVIGSAFNDILTGDYGNNMLYGAAGNDTLDGYSGTDTLFGGLGDDTYYLTNGDGFDTVNEDANGGFDTVYSVNYTLPANVERLYLLAVGHGFSGTGNALANFIYGNGYNDVLSGLAGNDTLEGGGGNDTLDGGTGADTMVGGVGNDTYVVDNLGDVVTEFAAEGTDDVVRVQVSGYVMPVNVERAILEVVGGTLNGNGQGNILQGTAGDDTINAGAGDDTIIGGEGAGNDTYDGGADNDTVIYSSATIGIAVNLAAASNQAIGTEIGTDQLANVENVIGGSGNDTLTGNGAANVLNGGTGNDVLAGGGGNDTLDGSSGVDNMAGGAGNDIYFVDNAGDAVTENANEGSDTVYSLLHYTLTANVETLVLQGAADLQGYGNALTNTLTGNSGNNLLNGAGGADNMIGVAGNDTYFIDNAGDVVTENVNEGNDAIFASISYTLGANVETLILQGSADLQGYGNGAVNTLYGNTGNNLLDGGAGADRMYGGVGNDVYFADNSADAVFENANEGNDSVFANVSFTLLANVENLILQGSADLQGYGNALNNVLYGNTGNNLLNGGAGVDLMAGGTGNDVYFVDDPSDACFEVANQGNDSVFATCSYGLAADVEGLILQGTGDLQAYGNNQANTIYGNSGNNLINAGGGIDLMAGGLGDDVYYVDDPSDVCFEVAGQGNDAVFATCSYGLAADVETLILQGSANLQGYGNNTANTLYGNAGNNLLNGGGGADTMVGGAGNDVYFVDNAGDGIIENANEGNEAVFAGVSFALGANIEGLVLQGAGNIDGIGNALANSLNGNTGNNTLDGGAGADQLTGNAGNDTFRFTAGQAIGDAVVDFAGNGAAAGDSLVFFGYGGGATFAQVNVTLWQVIYNGGASHDFITFSNGAAIDSSDFQFI